MENLFLSAAVVSKLVLGCSGHFLFILCHCNPTVHSLTYVIHMQLQRTAWNVAFHQFNYTYILWSYMWTVHVTQFSVPLHWHKMYRKCPEHPSSRLLTTATERNKLPTGCYFFSPLLFSPHDMNVFVTDLTSDNVVTNVQRFSSGFLIISC